MRDDFSGALLAGEFLAELGDSPETVLQLLGLRVD